jgi:hypothetical protein
LSGTDKPKGVFFRAVNRVIDGGTSAMVSMLAPADPRARSS